MKTRILYLLSALVLLSGCFKDVSYKTDYVLKPLMQQVSGDVYQPVEGATAFAYDVDTTAWTVASYDDALNMTITLRGNPSQKRSDPIAVAEPDTREGFEGRIRMTLSRSSQMVVAVDPVNRIYAYTQQEIAENLPATYVSLIFKPYRQGFLYKDGNWAFCNDFYTPPIYLNCYLVPKKQEEEGGPETDFPVSLSDIRAYAFSADTTLWRIASYKDAADGIITSKLQPDQTRDNPNFPVYIEDDAYRMRVSSETLMIVVVDRKSSMYAYTKQVVDLEGEPVTFSVVFRPWTKSYVSLEDGWCVVDETYKPEDPDPLNSDYSQSASMHPNR